MSEAITRFSGEHAFLSNFYIERDGRTLEHRFQAAKAADPAESAQVLAAESPRAAKALGRRVRMRADWEQVKVAVMLDLLRDKFSDPALRARLLATGDAELVEGNTWGDRFWGVDARTWEGRNFLGRCLMHVRAELRLLAG